jgi:hypothetical protein
VNHGEGVTISLPKITGKFNGKSDKGKSILNDSVELCLKVILGHGPNGAWEVKWAGIDNPSVTEHIPTHVTVTKAVQKVGPKPMQTWKPRVKVGPDLGPPFKGPIGTQKPKSLDCPSSSKQPSPDPKSIFEWNIKQSCEYRFGTRFGLAIGMEYFDTGQYRHSISGLPQIYIYIYI